MTKMKFAPADNLVDEVWGKVGTPERDVMETWRRHRGGLHHGASQGDIQCAYEEVCHVVPP